MSLPEDFDVSQPPTIHEWPREARTTYIEMTWRRQDIITLLLHATGSLTEDRKQELQQGNLRLKKHELAAIIVALNLDIPTQ